LSPSQHHRKQPQTGNPCTHPDNSVRLLLHSTPSNRILRSPIFNCRRRIRLNIFCRHRFPRTTRNYWLIIPISLPSTTNHIPLYI